MAFEDRALILCFEESPQALETNLMDEERERIISVVKPWANVSESLLHVPSGQERLTHASSLFKSSHALRGMFLFYVSIASLDFPIDILQYAGELLVGIHLLVVLFIILILIFSISIFILFRIRP